MFPIHYHFTNYWISLHKFIWTKRKYSKKDEKDCFNKKGEVWPQDHKLWLLKNTDAEYDLFQTFVLPTSVCSEAKCTHSSLGHLPSTSSSQVNHSPRQHCFSFQFQCKSYGPLSPGTVKYLALGLINAVQKWGRNDDDDVCAADCAVIVGN